MSSFARSGTIANALAGMGSNAGKTNLLRSNQSTEVPKRMSRGESIKFEMKPLAKIEEESSVQ